MLPLIRWMVAIALAFVLLLVVVGIYYCGLLAKL